MSQEDQDSYETPKGIPVCDLHANTSKEIGVIKTCLSKNG